eukprot:3994279-Prymnesium_polylepis.1
MDCPPAHARCRAAHMCAVRLRARVLSRRGAAGLIDVQCGAGGGAVVVSTVVRCPVWRGYFRSCAGLLLNVTLGTFRPTRMTFTLPSFEDACLSPRLLCEMRWPMADDVARGAVSGRYARPAVTKDQ